MFCVQVTFSKSRFGTRKRLSNCPMRRVGPIVGNQSIHTSGCNEPRDSRKSDAVALNRSPVMSTENGAPRRYIAATRVIQVGAFQAVPINATRTALGAESQSVSCSPHLRTVLDAVSSCCRIVEGSVESLSARQWRQRVARCQRYASTRGEKCTA